MFLFVPGLGPGDLTLPPVDYTYSVQCVVYSLSCSCACSIYSPANYMLLPNETTYLGHVTALDALLLLYNSTSSMKTARMSIVGSACLKVI